MKTLLKSFTSLSFMLFLNVAIYAQPADYVNYYPIDNSSNPVADVKSGLDGTLIGCSLTTDRNGNASSAIAMNGTSDYVSLPQLTLMPSATYSFSFWFKANNVSTTQYLFSSFVSNDPSNFLFCSISNGKVTVTALNHSCPQGFSNPVTISINTWHYVVITVTNSTTINLYVDGIKASYSYFNPLPSFSVYSNSWIGRCNITPVNAVGYFNGAIDEVMFFNRPVTDAEVSQLSQILPNWTRNGANIYYSGNVGIGCDNPSVKLAVNGKIQATEVEIKSAPCSDYVFEKGYKLTSLSDLEKFVTTNKHLPEVPSAKEFEEKGYSVGQMDDMLLRKVEELTLYMLELKKENSELKNKIEMLKKN